MKPCCSKQKETILPENANLSLSLPRGKKGTFLSMYFYLVGAAFSLSTAVAFIQIPTTGWLMRATQPMFMFLSSCLSILLPYCFVSYTANTLSSCMIAASACCTKNKKKALLRNRTIHAIRTRGGNVRMARLQRTCRRR